MNHNQPALDKPASDRHATLLNSRRIETAAATLCLLLAFTIGCNREATDEEMMNACEHSLRIVNEAQAEALSESANNFEMPSLQGLGQTMRCTGSALGIAFGSERPNKSLRWTRCVQAANTVDELEACDSTEAARN